MPAAGIRLHGAVLLGYLSVAVAFSWPLPLHLTTAVLGPVSSDLGVYVWNLWVFGHELTHGRFPFLTNEILALATEPVPLTLHNYTPAANLVALTLQPLVGTVGAFNTLTIASFVLASYTTFLLARSQTGDVAASWIAGLAFGFSPFMSARALEHFSLVQVAPVPLFVLLMVRVQATGSRRLALAAGATLAWAFLSDPYYAVYCALIGALLFIEASFTMELRRPARRSSWRHAVTAVLLLIAGVIAVVLAGGGGRYTLLGVRISLTQLYTPVLAFVVLLALRVLLSVRPRVTWVRSSPPVAVIALIGVVAVALLAPVLLAMVAAYRDSELISPGVLWRSSPSGVDLLAFFRPNPLHPWFGDVDGRMLTGSSVGFVERVAAIPWTAVVAIALAGLVWRALPRFWLVFTGVFLVLALGPFVRVAGELTYVPTPWALLRYVPIIGAARMPTRFSIIVMLGVAVLLAWAVAEIRRRSSRPTLVTASLAAILLLELLPAPRVLHSADVPHVFRAIATDPGQLRVLNLPFGLRDGMSSYGDINAAAQYHQTVHEKPMLGAYLSRLPLEDVRRYRERPITAALITLSERGTLSEAQRAEAIRDARQSSADLRIGYVIVDTTRASPALIDFAREAFRLELMAEEGPYRVYRPARGDD